MTELERIVAQDVFIAGEHRPFGALTADDVRSRADELRAAVGWGPTARVAPVAQAWRELAMALDGAGAGTVASSSPRCCSSSPRGCGSRCRAESPAAAIPEAHVYWKTCARPRGFPPGCA